MLWWSKSRKALIYLLETMESQHNSKKSTIRVMHNLGRSGGTLISKCFGCMKNIALLSEIHPDAQHAHSFNVINQAQQWFDLDKTIPWKTTDFLSALNTVKKHCLKNNQQLFLRDWSHIDYFGLPVTNNPKNTPTLLNTLNDEFRILSVQSLRNPVDTWLSLRRLTLIKKAGVTPTKFINAYLIYLEKTVGDYRLLYENFLSNPNQELQNMCIALELEFDAEYESKWYHYQNITGDLSNSSSLRETQTIKPRARRELNPDTLLEIEELKDSHAYSKILESIPEYNVT